MAKKPTRAKKPQRRWRIVQVKKRGHPLGTVEAEDAASAMQAAAKLFGVDPARLIAQPME
jgi:hypothetical protein